MSKRTLSILTRLLDRFFAAAMGGLGGAELDRLGRLVRRLEDVLDPSAWPTANGKPLTLVQWDEVLRATDRRAGFWDGHAEPPPPPEEVSCPDGDAAVEAMAERLGFDVSPNRRPIQFGLWHPLDVKSMRIADDGDLAHQGLLGTARGDLMDAREWREDDDEPDPYPGFGVRPHSADECRRSPWRDG